MELKSVYPNKNPNSLCHPYSPPPGGYGIEKEQLSLHTLFRKGVIKNNI
jgi:hypothetical protein